MFEEQYRVVGSELNVFYEAQTAQDSVFHDSAFIISGKEVQTLQLPTVELSSLLVDILQPFFFFFPKLVSALGDLVQVFCFFLT